LSRCELEGHPFVFSQVGSLDRFGVNFAYSKGSIREEVLSEAIPHGFPESQIEPELRIKVRQLERHRLDLLNGFEQEIGSFGGVGWHYSGKLTIEINQSEVIQT
jgi:hypothetical protein